MSERNFSHVKVVVIDDNKNMRELLKAMLQAFGVKTILEADDGETGLQLIKTERPDFLFTDYAMKPMDGIEFTKIIRRMDKDIATIPIIMITGHTERRYVELARDAGVTDTLCKPVTALGLYTRICNAVDHPRKFVRSPHYTGPDRRRRDSKDYAGERRRAEDKAEEKLDLTFL